MTVQEMIGKLREMCGRDGSGRENAIRVVVGEGDDLHLHEIARIDTDMFGDFMLYLGEEAPDLSMEGGV